VLVTTIFDRDWPNEPPPTHLGWGHIIISDSRAGAGSRLADMGSRQSLVRALGVHAEPAQWAGGVQEVRRGAGSVLFLLGRGWRRGSLGRSHIWGRCQPQF